MRKMASVQVIWKVEPIEDADRIELGHVMGWQCVVNKGVFKPMDKGVYFEIDSYLPVDPRFEFLRAGSYKNSQIMGEGFKIKTMKFRGQISQGLFLPLSQFPEIPEDAEIGTDVTELLHVKKWEVEERATTSGTVAGTLPYDVPCTDEPRCLDGHTKLLTTKGLIAIADIVNKKIDCKILTCNPETGTFLWETITSSYRFNSKEPLCVLKFPFRYDENRTNTLKTTLDHKLWTNVGWKTAQEITTQDKVYLQTKAYTKDVLQYVAGMIIGDSCLNTEQRNNKDGTIYKKARISFTQGEKQLSYLQEKLRLLGQGEVKIRQGRSGYCQNKIYLTSLRIDDTIQTWLNTIYPKGMPTKKNGIPKINKDFVEYLTPISLALWYMDDGTITKRARESQKSTIRIGTYAYTEEENKLLIQALLNKFGVRASLQTDARHKNAPYFLYLSVEATMKFQQLIAPFVCPSMRYKLDKQFQNEPYLLQNTAIDKELQLIPVPVVDKSIWYKSSKATRGVVYNICTPINHTYFASGALVHNCQSYPELIKEFQNKEYYITTKMDGSSHSVSLDGDGFHVTGHHYEYKDDDSNSFYRLVKERGWRKKIEAYAKEHNYMPFTLQGELCAPGIQRNRLKLIKPEWYVFTVRINGKRVGLQETVKVCRDLGMEMVPIEEIGFNFPEKYPTVESVLERADGTYPKGGPKEGIVIRPVEPVFSTVLSAALSMKAVNNRYLLKNEE